MIFHSKTISTNLKRFILNRKSVCMKVSLQYAALLFLLFSLLGCEKDKDENTVEPLTTKVFCQEIDDKIVVEDITKVIEIDLNDDREIDIAFEIINLNEFNQNSGNNDSLAARVITPNVEILDNSTWGYADALDKDIMLTETMYWNLRETFVLGTNPTSFFNGQGIKYLGFRLPQGNDFYYGWVKLECSQFCDELHIISFGISQEANHTILTGQK